MRCSPPQALLLAPTFVLDMQAAREACGQREPEVALAVRQLMEAMAEHASRLTGQDQGGILREEYRRFLAARREIYADPIRQPGAQECAAAPVNTLSTEAVLRRIADIGSRIDQAVQPGGPLSRPECREE